MKLTSVVRKLRDRRTDNGTRWTVYYVLSRGASRIGHFFESRAREIERERGVPGVNSVAANRATWSSWDWGAQGEEWTVSEEWRNALVEEFMEPHLKPGADVVEIGPGAGRWTGELHDRARNLYLVDLTRTTLDLCLERLGHPDNVQTIVTEGSSLPGIDDGSIDFIWAFDVFVHVAPGDQRGYLADMARVMRPGARAVIHHAGTGGQHDKGWRSSMTAELFAELVEASGCRVLRQTGSWGAGEAFRCTEPGDVITVFER